MHIIHYHWENATEDQERVEQLIARTVQTTLANESFDDIAEVSVSLVLRRTIKQLNQQHRDKDTPTDVLSFTQYDDEGFDAYEDEPVFIGDIVICLPVAQEQADQFGHSFAREVAYLTCHATLHLLGYDHLDEADKQLMRSREKAIIKQLGLTINTED